MLFLLFNGMKKAKYRFSNKCSIPGLYDERHHPVRRKKNLIRQKQHLGRNGSFGNISS